MVPEYPENTLGIRVINDENTAYWMAVNRMLVRLDKKATKAAEASPPARLSAEMTQ